MRIYKDRVYIIEKTPGLSGFQRWGETEHTIVNGSRAQHERSYVIAEYSPGSFPEGSRFYAQDGHVPGYQPSVDPDDIESAARTYHMGIRVEPA